MDCDIVTLLMVKYGLKLSKTWFLLSVKNYQCLASYATALQHCYILDRKKLLWLVVSLERRVTTVKFGHQNRLFSTALAYVLMESFVLY